MSIIHFARLLGPCLFIINGAFAAFAMRTTPAIVEGTDAGVFSEGHYISLEEAVGAKDSQEKLTIFFRKQSAAAPGYEQGIYSYTIEGCADLPVAALYFRDYLELKGKSSALLRLKFSGSCPKRDITLPVMDCVIEGDNFSESTFFIGHRQVENNKRYFFKDKLRQQISLRPQGQVFAQDPGDIKIFQDHPNFKIAKIERNSLEHFAVLNAFYNDRDYKDEHAMPARKHQIMHLLQYAQALKKGVKKMVVDSATGSGKSYEMQRLAQLVQPKKVLIVTPRENLISQLAEGFKHNFKDLKVCSTENRSGSLKNFLGSAIKANDVVITSLQGLQMHHKDPGLLKGIGVLIFDEAHYLLSKDRAFMIDSIEEANPGAEMLFYTATPRLAKRHHESGLTSVYQLSKETVPHIQPFNIRAAVAAGVNAPFQLALVKDLPITLRAPSRNEKKKSKLVSAEALGANLDQNVLHLVVLDIYLNAQFSYKGKEEAVSDHYAMAFCASISHAENLASYLRSMHKSNDHEQAYKKAVNDYLESFVGQTAPVALKALFEEIGLTHKGHFLFGNEVPRIAQKFLHKYPYVFADAIHAGNETHPLSSNSIKLKILRNKLGGSSILCGADMLLEGFDNPLIKVGFNVSFVTTPAKAIQRFGRLLRSYQGKVALAIDFLYKDDEGSNVQQLPLFNFFPEMNVGTEPLTLSFKNHEPMVCNYSLTTELVREGYLLPRNAEAQEQKATSQRVSKESQKRAHKEINETLVMDEVEALMVELESLAKQLENYSLLVPEEEAMEEDDDLRIRGTSAMDPVPRRGSFFMAPSVQLVNHCRAQALIDGAYLLLAKEKTFFAGSQLKKKPRVNEMKDQRINCNGEPSPRTQLQNVKSQISGALNRIRTFMNDCNNKTAPALAPAMKPPMPLREIRSTPPKAIQNVQRVKKFKKIKISSDLLKNDLEDLRSYSENHHGIILESLNINGLKILIQFLEQNPNIAENINNLEILLPGYYSHREELFTLYQGIFAYLPGLQYLRLKVEGRNNMDKAGLPKTGLAKLKEFHFETVYTEVYKDLHDLIIDNHLPALEFIIFASITNETKHFNMLREMLVDKGWKREGHFFTLEKRK